MRKRCNFLLSSFVIIYLVCFYDVNETNVNYEKLCFSKGGLPLQQGSLKKIFRVGDCLKSGRGFLKKAVGTSKEIYSVYPSPPLVSAGGVLSVRLFKGVAVVSLKKTKLWNINDKKIYKQMFFSVITENLNWNILIKNLVSFNRWNGVKDEKF